MPSAAVGSGRFGIRARISSLCWAATACCWRASLDPGRQLLQRRELVGTRLALGRPLLLGAQGLGTLGVLAPAASAASSSSKSFAASRLRERGPESVRILSCRLEVNHFGESSRAQVARFADYRLALAASRAVLARHRLIPDRAQGSPLARPRRRPQNAASRAGWPAPSRPGSCRTRPASMGVTCSPSTATPSVTRDRGVDVGDDAGPGRSCLADQLEEDQERSRRADHGESSNREQHAGRRDRATASSAPRAARRPRWRGPGRRRSSRPAGRRPACGWRSAGLSRNTTRQTAPQRPIARRCRRRLSRRGAARPAARRRRGRSAARAHLTGLSRSPPDRNRLSTATMIGTDAISRPVSELLMPRSASDSANHGRMISTTANSSSHGHTGFRSRRTACAAARTGAAARRPG